jgi:transmembrane sensor
MSARKTPAANEAAAARWAVRLEGDPLSAAEQRALNAWLAQHPAHRAQLSELCQFSADLERSLPALVADGAFDVAQETAAVARPAWRPWLPVAGLAAAAMVVFGLWFNAPVVAPRAISTPPSHRQSIALADGTRADLNAQTTLKVDFSDEHRRLVRLERGEALFNVAKNPDRPFIVETPGGRVRVTGTVFNVRTDASGRLEVSVIEGTVEVQPGAGAATAAEPLHLGIGDQVALETGRVALRRVRPEVAAEAAAWRDGWVVFDAVPLGEALQRFAAFHGRTITVAPEIAGERLGGRFGLDDLDGFLKDLERALPVVRVERLADGGARVGRR